jgi:hypothetical protein
MSKRFRAHSSSVLDPTLATAKTDQQKEREKGQVSALYELGLLGGSDKRSRRREKDKSKVLPGEAKASGSHPKRSTHVCISTASLPFLSFTPYGRRTDPHVKDHPLTSPPDDTTAIDSSRGITGKSSSIQPSYSKDGQGSSEYRSRTGGGMAGLLDNDRSRSRRERTFVGSECAVCEEPLEHTLRGERILQFSCGHVSHEACFYEYIKEFESQYCPTCNAPLGLDTSRGGNILDIGKKFDSGSSSLYYTRKLIPSVSCREAK